MRLNPGFTGSRVLAILMIGVLMTGSVSAVGLIDNKRSDALPEAVPMSHPQLGTEAGCEITHAPFFGHFHDPVGHNDCPWNPDGIDGGVEVFFFECSRLCMVLVYGKDSEGVTGNFFIQCKAGAQGRYVLTDDLLADLLLEDKGTDACTVFSEGGSAPASWVRSYGYIEDMSWLGGTFRGSFATDWRDVLIDDLLGGLL